MTDAKDNQTIDIEEAITIETHHANIVEVQQIYGDNLPYQRERVITEARFYREQAGEAMLQFGKRLIQIKENEPHGEFIDIAENDFGISRSTAHQMMQASIKYLSLSDSNVRALGHLGKAKLFDLVTQDSEDLKELAEGGTVAGLTLDDIDKMTTRELKKALRETREDNEAARRRSAERLEENDKLKDQIDKLKKKRKIELDKNDIVSLQAEYKESWLGIDTQFVSAMCDTKALLAKASDDQLPDSFYQQIAVQIIEVRDHLNDILSLLPSDIPSHADDEWNPDE